MEKSKITLVYESKEKQRNAIKELMTLDLDNTIETFKMNEIIEFHLEQDDKRFVVWVNISKTEFSKIENSAILLEGWKNNEIHIEKSLKKFRKSFSAL